MCERIISTLDRRTAATSGVVRGRFSAAPEQLEMAEHAGSVQELDPPGIAACDLWSASSSSSDDLFYEELRTLITSTWRT